MVNRCKKPSKDEKRKAPKFIGIYYFAFDCSIAVAVKMRYTDFILQREIRNMDYSQLKEYMQELSKFMTSPPVGDFKHPCIIVSQGNVYTMQLWDWGNWVNNIALRQRAMEEGDTQYLYECEKGSVLNFLDQQKPDGSIEIAIFGDPEKNYFKKLPHRNVHKPVLAQHVAFILKYSPDVEWIRPHFSKLKAFNHFYEENAKHESGLFYFFDDFAIGVDNDPSTFYRPDNSSASIYINSLMYMELGAMAYIAQKLGESADAESYRQKQEALRDAINAHCYDEKDGMYYSCDINLRPIEPNVKLHSGMPRHYSTLIQRLGCWSSFLPLWAGIPTKEQAERIVKENLLDEKAFWAPYGVRSLSKYEKMYRIVGSSNPSSWHGGVWILSNYFIYKGLLRYGYKAEGEELAKKTVDLLARDYAETGAFHEYYHPETGEGVWKKGFSSWNLLAWNLLAYLEGRECIEEFTS